MRALYACNMRATWRARNGHNRHLVDRSNLHEDAHTLLDAVRQRLARLAEVSDSSHEAEHAYSNLSVRASHGARYRPAWDQRRRRTGCHLAHDELS